MRLGRLIALPTLLVLFLLLASGPTVARGAEPDGPPGLVRAVLAQEHNTDALMAHPGVVGTGVGQDGSGDWVVVIFTEAPGVAGLPTKLDGAVGVDVRAIGRVYAAAPSPTVATFTYSCAGLSCSFDASASTGQGAGTFTWTFGDGGSGSGVTTSHTYTAGGSYTVVLTVKGTASGTDTDTQTVTVSSGGGGGGGGGGSSDCYTSGATTVRCNRPAPLGVSLGHPSITAGTLGARVRDSSGNVFILSNNHVMAAENAASIGDDELQPGPYDGGQDPADSIGTLADFQVLRFNDSTNTNVMDAAIASTTTAETSNSTAAVSYGTPSSTTAPAYVGQSVRKRGRTTGDTFGTVSAINVSLGVCYAGYIICTTTGYFTGQVAIGTSGFSDGGDSGSLIVTNDSQHNPVALLFAGSSTTTFGNPIDPILARFGVSIDDGSPIGQPPVAAAGGPYFGAEDSAVAFDASGSSDPEGDTLTYAWDFGDGTSGTGVAPAHAYLWGGDFTVSVEVSDGHGNTDTAATTATVTEVNDAPVADAGGPYAGSVASPIAFNGSGSYDFDDLDGTTANDQALSYSWDFGDGAQGSGASPSHAYVEGSYIATLTVDDGVAVSVDTASVTVSAAPAGVTVTGIAPNTMSAGSTVNATISGTGFAAGAAVSFGNGTGPAPTASGVTVVDDHTINLGITVKSGGPHRVRMWDVTVANTDGGSGTLAGGLTVNP